MSIKRKKVKKPSPNATESAPAAPDDTKRGQSLTDLVSTLQSVDTKSKEVKANETSMDDNNGGRIWYNWLWETLKGGQKDNKK